MFDGREVPVHSLNTLVIGSGAAARRAALELVRQGQRDVAIVTERWNAGTSYNAGSDKQTYYKLSLGGGVPDSVVDLATDLFAGGCMHGDIALCEAQHSAQVFFDLAALGVPFPHDRHGGYVAGDVGRAAHIPAHVRMPGPGPPERGRAGVRASPGGRAVGT